MPVTVIFASGKKLGIGDHIVTWQRPQQCPQSMNRADFAALPETLQVREVHLLIQPPGFRPQEIILVTTLLDPKRYPKAKLAQLYQLRWMATEVNFKHLKTTLKMEIILAKTPEMVRTRNLGANTCLQFAPNADVAGGSGSASVVLADFLTRYKGNNLTSSDLFWQALLSKTVLDSTPFSWQLSVSS
jgi:hypothetical protein